MLAAFSPSLVDAALGLYVDHGDYLAFLVQWDLTLTITTFLMIFSFQVLLSGMIETLCTISNGTAA